MKRRTRTGTLALWMVVLLIILAPLPEGSAYPWALPIIEVLVFGLVAAWQLTTALDRGPRTPFSRARPFLLPLLLFMALATLQLVSLPPAVLRIVSPATYRLYEMSLPGWPREQPDQILTLRASSDRSQWSVLPTVSEDAAGIKAFASSRSAANRHVAGQLGDNVRTLSPWRPLSIAPSMTEGVLLALAEYAALFFLIGNLLLTQSTDHHHDSKRRDGPSAEALAQVREESSPTVRV